MDQRHRSSSSFFRGAVGNIMDIYTCPKSPVSQILLNYSLVSLQPQFDFNFFESNMVTFEQIDPLSYFLVQAVAIDI